MLLLPVVVTMVFLVIHAALVYHARSVVAAAAEGAARVAQAEGGTAGGRAVADEVLRGSDGLLPAPSVHVERSATTVTVTVSGQVRGPIPWLRARRSRPAPVVRSNASSPSER